VQTFLPYPSFARTAKCLDSKRLGKQRVEALQIHNIVSGKRTIGGWVNHPAVKMWFGYSDALALYHNAMIAEWKSRGFQNNMSFIPIHNSKVTFPHWLGNYYFHSSHRSNLMRKFPEHYGLYLWSEDASSPYLWPVQ